MICTKQTAKTIYDVGIIRNIELGENKWSTKRSKKNKYQAAPRGKTRVLCSPKARRNSAWEITPTAFIMRALNSDSSVQRQIADLRCTALDFRCFGRIANLTPICLKLIKSFHFRYFTKMMFQIWHFHSNLTNYRFFSSFFSFLF